jgi:hypothetical protein
VSRLLGTSNPVTTYKNAMLCYAMLRYATLCYATIRYATLCYAMLCCAMLCYAMLCYVEVDSGEFDRDARAEFPIASSAAASFAYTIWRGLRWSVLGTASAPSGLALGADAVYVAAAGGRVLAFDLCYAMLCCYTILCRAKGACSPSTAAPARCCRTWRWRA